MRMKKQGLLLVHTGDGKGKTTAALGLALRAWGDGMRVCILQFIKGSWEYGELRAIEALAQADGRIQITQCGLGFTRKDEKKNVAHRRAAEAALEKARVAITCGAWDLVILDELNYAVKFGLVSEAELMALLDLRPLGLHLLITGRDACPALIERADLVTEMRLVKHPFQQGIKAQKGIEF